LKLARRAPHIPLLKRNTQHTNKTTDSKQQYAKVNLSGSGPLGAYTLVLCFLVLALDHQDFGFGAWQPVDWFWYEKKVSPLGLAYGALALPTFGALPSAFAGVCLLITSAVSQHSFKRQEAGDGGREMRKGQAARAKAGAEKRKAALAKNDSKNASAVFDGYPSDWYCLQFMCRIVLTNVFGCVTGFVNAMFVVKLVICI
jgi:hypothetical protein